MMKLNNRPKWKMSLGTCLVACCALAMLWNSRAAVPSPEKLLPSDTLVLLTAPDSAKLREIYQKSPGSQLWNDPAMKPFKDKFLAKLKEDV